MQTPPRVALFTPLPPSRTGTADYAAELIESLGNHVNLEVLAEIPRRFRPSDFDLLLYQIANNPYHKPFYDAALRWPGIVTLHETNLNHLLRGEGEASYLREVAYEVLGRDGELPMEDLSVLGEPDPISFRCCGGCSIAAAPASFTAATPYSMCSEGVLRDPWRSSHMARGWTGSIRPSAGRGSASRRISRWWACSAISGRIRKSPRASRYSGD